MYGSSAQTQPLLGEDSGLEDNLQLGHQPQDHHDLEEADSSLMWLTFPQEEDISRAYAAENPSAYPTPPGSVRVAKPFPKRSGTAIGTRARRTAWICIDASSKRSFIHADKRAVIHGLGLHIPIRDMRLLDFNLLASDTRKILVRDVAIIFSMEHIRLIITADKAIVPREGTEQMPHSDRFVDVLEDAVADWAKHNAAYERQEQRAQEVPHAAAGSSLPTGADAATDTDDDVSGTIRHELHPLPFELVVLESALKEVVASSSQQIRELEGVALPALDALTKSVNTANLERVRKVKTRHQRLLIRCEALREELQRFLGDDDDMTRMCLTRKIEVEEAAKAAAAQMQQAQHLGTGQQQPQHQDQQAQQRQQEGMTMPIPAQYPQRQNQMHVGSFNRRSALFRSSGAVGGFISPTGGGLHHPSNSFGSTPGPAAMYEDEELDAEAQQDVENLLESYFMQVDGLFDKLVSIGEYIKDTEEYINIELDSSRNRLIRLEIILTAATFALAPFNLLAGILGENLVIPDQLTKTVTGFYGLNFLAFCFCFFVFYGIMTYMKYRKLL